MVGKKFVKKKLKKIELSKQTTIMQKASTP
jgi:hypothetical protein